ncbi:MAG: lysylphosphatidylglycerol synthase transmembrane domain-containing protein [Chloroflexota bacterium]
MRRWIILAVSVVVSVVFLVLALRDVPIRDVIAGIQQADFGWVLLSMIGVVGTLATRAVRWRGLLDNRIPLIQAFHILNITMLLNLLPLRAGELARSLLATRSGVPVVTAATSIVVERLIDVVAVVLMIALAVSRLPAISPVVTQAATFFGAAAVIAFVVLVSFARYPQIAHRVLEWLKARIPLLARLNGRKRADEVLDGLRPLTHPRRALHALVWTVIAWTTSLLTFYALERALQINNVDQFAGALLGVALVSLSLAVPVSVASLGPFESAVRVAGDAVSMTALAGTTLGFLFHGISVLGYAIFGVIGLIALGVSLSDVMSKPAPAPAETESTR